jgi:hypothetical protein
MPEDTADTAPADEHTCPNCGGDLVLATRIRRAFGNDTYIFTCLPCGIKITEPAAAVPSVRRDRLRLELSRVVGGGDTLPVNAGGTPPN